MRHSHNLAVESVRTREDYLQYEEVHKSCQEIEARSVKIEEFRQDLTFEECHQGKDVEGGRQDVEVRGCCQGEESKVAKQLEDEET